MLFHEWLLFPNKPFKWALGIITCVLQCLYILLWNYGGCFNHLRAQWFLQALKRNLLFTSQSSCNENILWSWFSLLIYFILFMLKIVNFKDIFTIQNSICKTVFIINSDYMQYITLDIVLYWWFILKCLNIFSDFLQMPTQPQKSLIFGLIMHLIQYKLLLMAPG